MRNNTMLEPLLRAFNIRKPNGTRWFVSLNTVVCVYNS